MKKILVAVVAIGLMVGGAGMAWATTSGDASGPAAGSKPAARATALRRQVAKGAIGVVADTLHIDRKTLVQELRSGKTIAEVADEHHVATQTVVDAIVNAAKQKVAALVQHGKLTQPQADKIDARLPQLATRLVNRHFGGHGGAGADPQGGADAAQTALAA